MSLHTVAINPKLKPMKTRFSPVRSETSVTNYWLHNIHREDDDFYDGSTKKCESLYTIVNGPYTEISSNAILESFIWAYYRHHDIVLSPDDMWLLVSMYFPQHVNNLAEELRSTFVEHNEGQVTLTVVDLNEEYDWDNFFDRIKVEILANTKNNVCQLLTADFSTTGKVELILSTA